MAVTNFSPLLGLALPTTGDLSGTWGDVVNQQITDLIDDAIAGTTTLSTDADVTLTTTNGGDNQARQAILNCTGARTALRTITAPAQSKVYVVQNNTSGGYNVKIVGAGPTTGVQVIPGENAVVAWNGSDFEIIASSVIDLTSEVINVLPVANGGTGASSLTANNVVLGNGTSAVQFVAPGTTGNVLTSDGSTWVSSPGGGSMVYPDAGIPVSTGSAWSTSKTAPSGDLVGTTDTQTLSGKTITAEKEVSVSVSASAIDLTTANYFYKTITADTTFTVSGAPSSGTAQAFILELTNGGAYTITWFANLTFPGGVAPTLTASGRDVLAFFTRNGGTTWSGFVVGRDMLAA